MSRQDQSSSVVEQRVLAALEHCADPLVALALDGSIEFMSTSARAMCGVETHEILGRRFDSLVHVGDRARLVRCLDEIIAGAPYAICDYRIIRADGRSVASETTFRPARLTPTGAIVGFGGPIRALSARVSENAGLGGDTIAEMLIENAAEHAIFLLDPDGNVQSWNVGAERIMGYAAAEIVGTSFSRFYTPPDNLAGFPARSLDIVRATGKFDGEGWRVRKDGTPFWASVVINAVRDANGETIGFAKVTRDITSRLEAEAALRLAARDLERIAERDRATVARLAEKNRLMAMAERIASVGHWRLDLDANEVFWSDQICITTGRSLSSRPSLADALAAYHPDDRSEVAALVDRAITNGESFTHASRIVRLDGAVRHVVSSGQAERRPDGSIGAIFGVLQDVTEKKERERERERLIERMNVATRIAGVGIWEWDVVQNIKVWDVVMFSLYGRDSDSAAPTFAEWSALVLAEDRVRAQGALRDAIDGISAYDTEFRIMLPNGEIRHIRAIGTRVAEPDATVISMIGANWDVTELRELANQLRAERDAATVAATHDALTGLANRRGLEMWLESHADVNGTLLYLDVDGFKAVNDRCGHATGDDTLRRVARIIGAVVREEDFASRIGGDEFLIVLPDVCDVTTTADITARIVAAVDALAVVPGDGVRIGISIGSAPLDGAASFDKALRIADAELYRDKTEHRSRIRRS